MKWDWIACGISSDFTEEQKGPKGSWIGDHLTFAFQHEMLKQSEHKSEIQISFFMQNRRKNVAP